MTFDSLPVGAVFLPHSTSQHPMIKLSEKTWWDIYWSRMLKASKNKPAPREVVKFTGIIDPNLISFNWGSMTAETILLFMRA